jgi:hypothetical protein
MQFTKIVVRRCLGLLLFLAACSTAALAQWEDHYVPLASDAPRITSARTAITSLKDREMAKIDPKKQKLLHDAMTERYGSLQTKLEQGHILYDSTAYAYLDAILKEIHTANPDLPKSSIRLLLARYPWPNATSHGEGTILLNIGLVPHLENESQLAFVLCHEIAHYVLDHVDNAIRQRIATLESEEMQKQLKEIARTEYGARAKAMELLKDVSYDAHRHSRLHEGQADSLALVLLLRTRYDATEALKCLGILDQIDTDDTTDIHLRTWFHSQQLPFNPAWLKSTESGFGHTEAESELDEDSLKTHPDCAKRIAALAPRLEDYQSRGKSVNPQGEAAFHRLAMTCTFERVPAHFFLDNVGKCLYQTLLLLRRYPRNTYLLGQVGMCLNLLYNAQKNHELGKYAAFPDQEFNPQYNQVLTLLQNIRLSDLGKLSYHFLQGHQGGVTDEYLLFATYESCKIVGAEEEKVAVREAYLQHYPTGQFVGKID